MKQETPFDTEDLEKKLDKEKSMIEKRNMNDLFVVNNTTYNLNVLEMLIKERQRLKAEVENIVSEKEKQIIDLWNKVIKNNNQHFADQLWHSHLTLEELKQKLGLLQEEKCLKK